MANQNCAIEHAEARRLYRSGIKSPVTIAKIVNKPRQTVAAWIKRGQWAEMDEQETLTTLDVAQNLKQYINELVSESRELREQGSPPNFTTTKLIVFLIGGLRKLDEDYDLNGSIIQFGHKYINYISTLDQKELPNKKEFVAALQKTLPDFIKTILEAE